ncbi:MAG: hypothetical protein ACRC7O_00975 [Fimbriiglobus sp.]
MSRHLWAAFAALGMSAAAGAAEPCPPVVQPQPCSPTPGLVPAEPGAQPGASPVVPNSPAAPTSPETAPTISPAPPAPPGAAFDTLTAQGTERGAQPVAAFRETMFGDLLGVNTRVTVVPDNGGGGGGGNNGGGGGGGVPDAARAALRLSIPVRYQGIKIADNESPMPQDRVFASYNYYYAVNNSLLPTGFQRSNVQRQVIGFEKTFLDGDISLGMRLPFVQNFGSPAVSGNDLGDLSIVLKGLLIGDTQTGDVLSAGLVVTAPTGNVAKVLVDGVNVGPHSTLLQPWVGFIKNQSDWFAQGFTSVVVPTESADTTLMFNSFGIGYWAYRNPAGRALTGITPVVEVHISTPFNNRDPDGLIYFQDQVNITGGSYFSFRRLQLGLAVGTSTIAPRPFQLEAIANLNYRF